MHEPSELKERVLELDTRRLVQFYIYKTKRLPGPKVVELRWNSKSLEK